jgi:menaquinone-specific isochorismate synthase
VISLPAPVPFRPGAIGISVRSTEIDDDTELLSRLPAETAFAWVRRGEGLVGWGEAARVELSGPERFSRAQRWWSTWCGEAAIDDQLGVPGSGPVAFASFAFDPRPGESVLVVPKVVLGRRGGRTWLTVVGDEAHPLRPTTPPERPTGIRWSQGSLSAPDWQTAVAQAITRISAGELDKVVLARDVVATVDASVDPRFLLNRLAQRFPECWTFAVDGLVGATPELLVRREGDLVTSRVLAGTVRRLADAAADGRLTAALLASGKDQEEHDFAVNSVAAALANHCTDLDVPSRPHVLRLANVAHLATDVTGRLADGSPALALAASLHPTAAVCGTPTERALALIREIEGLDRGRYSGPVGWIDGRGDGEFGIALRCAEISDNRLRLFAGCGIVAGSNPDSELSESQAKLVAVRDALESD